MGVSLGFMLPSIKGKDVLQAPHHGSPKANPRRLLEWARPAVAVACQGQPRGGAKTEDEYAKAGVQLLGTWPHGAVTVRSSADGLTVETHRTRLQLTLRRGRVAPGR
jgi:beta-lactamase superfamily II metal-dependent hydrolase